MTLHTCIKPSCGNAYTDSDPDAYYCPSCVEEKRAIAEKVDAQFSQREREPVVSELQEFEQSAKTFTDPNTGRKISFGRA